MPETRKTIWGNVAHNLSPVGSGSTSSPYRAAMVGPYLGMVRKAKKANTWSDRIHRPIGPPPKAIRTESINLPGVAIRRSTSAILGNAIARMKKREKRPIISDAIRVYPQNETSLLSTGHYLSNLITGTFSSPPAEVPPYRRTDPADNDHAGNRTHPR